MAKVRVYELARELNLDSKKLVEKLIAYDMNIKNYMSTLDEQAVVKARQIVSGAVSEVIEEKRIKPRVIRRRKKLVKVEQKAAAAKAKEEPKPELPPEEDKDQEAAAMGVESLEKAAEEPQVIEEALISEEVEISVPPGEEMPPVLEGAQEVEPLAGEVKAEIPEVDTEAKPEAKAKVKPKKKRKKKVDEPARIIKRPEEGPLGDILARQLEKRKGEPGAERPLSLVQRPAPPVPSETAKGVEEQPEKGKAARKRKDKKKVPEKESATKSIFRRRKREVYERADLYEGRTLKRKDRKTAIKSKEAVRKQRRTEVTVPKAIKRRIKVQEFVTVSELAKAMGLKASELMKKLMAFGATANINQPIDFETASVVADDFGYELELDTFQEDVFFSEPEDRAEDLEPRSPVVTIMGHVDHGKTSLLDYIRNSNIIGGESGGITQHIGAYYVETEGGDIAFLDTPGHEAFTAMRARGARVTDIIVLVVAADDGVMPQTREAVNHARAANIPIVVAINKIDKPEANLDKVKRELAELDLSPEEWGGDTIFGNISAKTGEGVQELLSLILLQSEMLELKGNPDKAGRGSIIEARLDKSKGPVATVLIKNGTVRIGEHFICGEHYGRVRAMLNHRGKKMCSHGR
jgi:translation initiation factor IF-2